MGLNPAQTVSSKSVVYFKEAGTRSTESSAAASEPSPSASTLCLRRCSWTTRAVEGVISCTGGAPSTPANHWAAWVHISATRRQSSRQGRKVGSRWFGGGDQCSGWRIIHSVQRCSAGRRIHKSGSSQFPEVLDSGRDYRCWAQNFKLASKVFRSNSSDSQKYSASVINKITTQINIVCNV